MISLLKFFSWWNANAALAHLDDEDLQVEDEGAQGLTIDAAGWIHGPGVIHMPSARGRGALSSPGGEPLCAARHATATVWGTAGAIARNWRKFVEKHSAHVTIGVIVKRAQDAEVRLWRKLGWHAESAQLAALVPGDAVLYQHRSLITVAWHAAGSTDGEVTSGTVNGLGLNYCSIGIEMECAGQVERDGAGAFRGWAREGGVGHGPEVPEDQVEIVGRRLWHRYPPAALALERRLDAALLARFPQLAGEVTVVPSAYSVRELKAKPVTRPAMQVGHVDIDPKRKSDPYPNGAGRGAP